MTALFQAILRYIAEVARSESGELLSVRRKAHLLQSEMYARLGQDQAETARPRAKAAALSATRCRHGARARHAAA